MKDFGTSLSPKSTRLRDSRYGPGRPASVPLRHTIASSAQAPQHSHNGLTAFRMRLHMLSAGYGTCGPFATPTIRTRLRLPGTTRLRFALHGAQRGIDEDLGIKGNQGILNAVPVCNSNYVPPLPAREVRSMRRGVPGRRRRGRIAEGAEGPQVP